MPGHDFDKLEVRAEFLKFDRCGGCHHFNKTVHIVTDKAETLSDGFRHKSSMSNLNEDYQEIINYELWKCASKPNVVTTTGRLAAEEKLQDDLHRVWFLA